MDGWIKLHRKITESAIFSDPDLLRLWIYCLSRAAYKETTWVVEKQEVLLQPGQFVTGRFALQQDYNAGVAPRKKIKDTTLWSWLKRLESFGNLDIKSYNKYSVVTVVNWSEYQETLTSEPQQNDNKLTTEPQQTDTKKNVKNLRTISTTSTTEPLQDVWFRLTKKFIMPSNLLDFFSKLKTNGYDESFCTELLQEAFESAENGSVNMRYLEKIRDRWIADGISSRKQSQEEKARRANNAESKGRTEEVRSGSNPPPSKFAFLNQRNRRSGT
ncbi:DnaD domain protein [Paenibacillus sp. FSL R5-0490]|uniref:DnaD domain protein n=1 Tax=Paenibacillus sp. FSL R5-0490 TaxID=1920424 RepID=UPI0030CE0A31